MRISDWSSDVCSSDLFIVAKGGAKSDVMHSFRNRSEFALALVSGGMGGATWQTTTRTNRERPATSVSPPAARGLTPFWAADRSEERRVGKECVRRRRSWWWPYH